MFEDWTNCHECEHNPTGDKCELFGRVIGMHGCSSGIERKPRNHFEEIKAMSAEDLALWLDAVSKSWYDEGYTKESDDPAMSEYPATTAEWIAYLKQEVEE